MNVWTADLEKLTREKGFPMTGEKAREIIFRCLISLSAHRYIIYDEYECFLDIIKDLNLLKKDGTPNLKGRKYIRSYADNIFYKINEQPLPCDVMVAPKTVIRKGCTMKALIKCIGSRSGKDAPSIDVRSNKPLNLGKELDVEYIADAPIIEEDE